MTSPSSRPHQALGEAIKEYRLERGATREQVKAAAQISLEYLAKIEQGRRNPQPDVLARIAEALGTTPAELLSRARRPPQEVAGGLIGAVAGAPIRGALAGPLLGASLVGALRSLRRRNDREQMLEELELRLSSLTDDELALLLTAFRQQADENGEDRGS